MQIKISKYASQTAQNYIMLWNEKQQHIYVKKSCPKTEQPLRMLICMNGSLTNMIEQTLHLCHWGKCSIQFCAFLLWQYTLPKDNRLSLLDILDSMHVDILLRRNQSTNTSIRKLENAIWYETKFILNKRWSVVYVLIGSWKAMNK